MSIIQALQVALIGLMAFASQALASDPVSRTVTFSVFLEGLNIGRHTLTFGRQGSNQVITVTVDIMVQ